MGKSLEILILEGVRGLGPEIGNIDTGGSVWGGYGQIQVIGYVNIVVPREGLKPEIGNVETLGVWGHTLGMLISGGGGGGVHIMGGWGSFGTNIGYVNIVGGRGPGAEFGDVNIWGVRVGGLGQISGMLILWGQGRGRGGVGGQTLGMLILGGLGTEMAMPILWACGVLGHTLGMLIF